MQRRVVQLLANGFEDHVGGEGQFAAGGLHTAVHQCLLGKAHASGVTCYAHNFHRGHPLVQHHAVGLCPLLFGGRGTHGFHAAAVHHVHHLGPQQLGLHSGIHGGHAAANHHHMVADGHGSYIDRLAQFGDEVHRVAHPGQVFARQAQRLHFGQAQAEKHGIEFGLQFV